MEEGIDAMARVRSYHRTAGGASDGFAALHATGECVRGDAGSDVHDFSNIAEECTRLAYFDGFIEAVSCRGDEPLRVLVDFSNGVCAIQVTVHACTIHETQPFGECHEYSMENVTDHRSMPTRLDRR